MKKVSYTLQETRNLLKQVQNDVYMSERRTRVYRQVVLAKKEIPVYVDRSVTMHAGTRYNPW